MTETLATLTPGEVRSLLLGCSTIVKPGETLVIQLTDATTSQVHHLQERADLILREHDFGFRILVVPGDGMAVAQPESDAAFAQRVARALQQNAMRNRFPMRPHG